MTDNANVSFMYLVKIVFVYTLNGIVTYKSYTIRKKQKGTLLKITNILLNSLIIFYIVAYSIITHLVLNYEYDLNDFITYIKFCQLLVVFCYLTFCLKNLKKVNWFLIYFFIVDFFCFYFVFILCMFLRREKTLKYTHIIFITMFAVLIVFSDFDFYVFFEKGIKNKLLNEVFDFIELSVFDFIFSVHLLWYQTFELDFLSLTKFIEISNFLMFSNLSNFISFSLIDYGLFLWFNLYMYSLFFAVLVIC